METKEEQLNKSDYTIDGILTIEKQLELIAKEEQQTITVMDGKNITIIDEKTVFRELLQKVKLIALHNIGLDIFTDTRYLSKHVRNNLQLEMHKFNEISEEEITRIFNEIVCNALDEHKNIEQIPIYKN